MMYRTRATIAIVTIPLLAGLAARGAQRELGEEPLAIAATAPSASGVLHFVIREAGGAPIPARLTFLDDKGLPAELFSHNELAPPDWAVRGHVVSSLAGRGAITVPPGRYEVIASRGLEWSLARKWIEFTAGEEVTWEAELAHEVDTSGFVSGDYHLHTLTYSGHGDANLAERIVTLVSEGVEFAVATDHNHNTDYAPIIAELGVGDQLTAVTGNEVSVPIGHFNVFPLEPSAAVLDSNFEDANELFRLARAEENRFGITPIIQLNHPRWDGIDYFDQAGLDPVTGESRRATWSGDFDSIEVLNENTAWGWFDPAVDGVPTVGNRHSTLRDWFHLLNRGHRAVAVGNSDSHVVRGNFPGYPRNFTASPTDDPSAIAPADVANAIRAGAVFTTVGPFVELTIEGRGPGALVTPRANSPHSVEVHVRIQAASWIDCDRVRVIWNGDLVRKLPVPAVRSALRLDYTFQLPVPEESDGWIVLLVDGDSPMEPLLHSDSREVLPFAIVNPVRVDSNRDGVWTSPLESGRERLRLLPLQDRSVAAAWADWRTHEKVTVLGLSSGELGAELAHLGLRDGDRRVRLAAARTAERGARATLLGPLRTAFGREGLDAYEGLALLRAQQTCGDKSPGDLVAWLERFDGAARTRYSAELLPLLGGTPVLDFQVLGPFAAPKAGDVQRFDHGPEESFEPETTFVGKNKQAIAWQSLGADGARGYLDLGSIAASPELAEGALVYAQTWLHVEEAAEVPCLLGTDDGSRVFLNGELIFDNPDRRGADPLEHFTTLPLSAGWNRVLFKVENGGGAFGLYFRLLPRPGTRVTISGQEPG